MRIDDKSYIWDMINASQDIADFTKNLTSKNFNNDKKTRFAVERQLLVIGEASKSVSDAVKKQYPDIPWRKIKELRNIIAHEYGEFLAERIWNISKKDIPELLLNLKKIKF
ncbi:MAG: DUF86 domain-containing protein [Endomicrobium sp.]|jgi:uncharacterized protein with HEPN domain|nr:DUF86 domain-containing protein [Endomicrobium sp.]